MTQTDMVFNLSLGQALRDMGLESAQEARRDALELGRAYCRKAALSRSGSLTATADDAALGFQLAGLPPDLLGNAAGSLFKGSEWEFTGKWVPSARTSNHGRYLRVWRYCG